MTRWRHIGTCRFHTPLMKTEIAELKTHPEQFAANYCWTDHPTLGIRRFPSFPTLPGSF